MRQVKLNNKVLKMLNAIYCRVSKNIRFDLMFKTTLIVVGCGAVGHLVEQFVRLGGRKVILFDNDGVERKNHVAQNFIANDTGKDKTKALKGRLKACEFEKGNPDIPKLAIETYGDFLDISDHEIESIIDSERSKGRQVILVMASDYHPVQARGNRIAIQLKVPTFWLGIYRMGKAGEIIFFLPGYNLPCYRCITETRYRFFDKKHLMDHHKGDFHGAGISSGLPMAATFIDAIASHIIIGFIHMDIDNNQHGKLFRRLLMEKRNFIQCQLDPDYKLNDEQDIFSQIRGPDLITFNTIFQQESKKTDCIDCPRFYRQVWNHTDYTRENYRQTIENFSSIKSGFSHSAMFVHPLLNEYASLFPEWEAHQNSAIKDENKLEIIVERNGKQIGSIPLDHVPVTAAISDLMPGHIQVRYNTGQPIWEGELKSEDLLWTVAFPDQAFELAADTGDADLRASRKIKILDGSGIIKIIPELEGGRLEIIITAPNKCCN